jgi:hypothetical protein
VCTSHSFTLSTVFGKAERGECAACCAATVTYWARANINANRRALYNASPVCEGTRRGADCERLMRLEREQSGVYCQDGGLPLVCLEGSKARLLLPRLRSGGDYPTARASNSGGRLTRKMGRFHRTACCCDSSDIHANRGMRGNSLTG